jgi:hypothetical protein
MHENMQFCQVFSTRSTTEPLLNELFDSSTKAEESLISSSTRSCSPPLFENPADISLQVGIHRTFYSPFFCLVDSPWCVCPDPAAEHRKQWRKDRRLYTDGFQRWLQLTVDQSVVPVNYNWFFTDRSKCKFNFEGFESADFWVSSWFKVTGFLKLEFTWMFSYKNLGFTGFLITYKIGFTDF